jgi:uncharacterized protein YjiK
MITLQKNSRWSRHGHAVQRQHDAHPRITLNRFALAQTVTLANIATDCSGVAHSPPTRSIFAIKNSTNAIYEYSETGTWLRTITTTGFADCEGICWMYDDYFGISEEDTSSIVIVRIQPGTASLTKAGGTTVNTGLGNLDANTGGGFEGVSYDPENHKFYVVKERQSTAPTRNGMRVYEVLMSGLAREIFSASAKLPASVTDLADLFYDRFSKHLFLLGQESETIIETDLNGTVFGISALPGPMTQAEGITFSADRRTMWLVGEPNEMRRFTQF